jgi:hypothetical protein
MNVSCEVQPYTGLLPSERLPVLVARRTASLLQDAALTSLFHSYRVELFESPFELFVARAAPISYALLSASADCSLLAAEAFMVRKQWPSAKILVLGPAPHWSARLEMCQWRRETLDKESIWDEGRSTSLSR